jgi:hypothetical protein
LSTPNKRAREELRDQKQRDKARRRHDKRYAPRGGAEITSSAHLLEPVPSIEEVMLSLQAGGRGDRRASPIPVKLFVGSLANETTSARLKAHFTPHGEVAEAAVITDRETGATRNFGFVTMVDRKDAARTIEATHRSELDGHTIVVNVATAR